MEAVAKLIVSADNGAASAAMVSSASPSTCAPECQKEAKSDVPIWSSASRLLQPLAPLVLPMTGTLKPEWCTMNLIGMPSIPPKEVGAPPAVPKRRRDHPVTAGERKPVCVVMRGRTASVSVELSRPPTDCALWQWRERTCTGESRLVVPWTSQPSRKLLHPAAFNRGYRFAQFGSTA
jgi:hypothetical protein